MCALLVGSVVFAQELFESQWAVGPPLSPGMGLAGPLLGSSAD
jgi:hypothetical protein